MKIRPLSRIMITALFFSCLSGALIGAQESEARIIKAYEELSDPLVSKEKLVNSLVEFLDIALILTASSEYSNEIEHHIDVAKNLFRNSSLFNDKARQYLSLAYRMVTGGIKYQKPPQLDEFVTPDEAQKKAFKYANKLVEDALSSVKRGNDGDAARLILELVLLVVTPISG